MSIIVDSITKTYGKQKALDNVSFEIKSGEIVGFLGPNGAGKSTMMKIISCFIPPDSGNIDVSGFNTIENSFEVKKNIGYLPENNPLYSEMYVREYLGFIAGIYKIANAKKEIERVISETGLTPESKKKISELSKGYKQRVGLAQVLLHNPSVLILDEPTSGLDPNQIVEIRNLIAKVGKEKTVLLSTHIMQEVEAICDRIIIINKGSIVANDQTGSIKSNISEKYSALRVEFNADCRKEDLEKINNVSKVLKLDTAKNWLISYPSDTDPRKAVFEFAVSKGIAVLSMHKEEKSLEDVFRQLTDS